MEAVRPAPKVNGSWQIIQSESAKPSIIPYLHRANHCSFYFKNALFLFAGLYVPPKDEGSQVQEVPPAQNSASFMRFNLLSREWSRMPLNLPANHTLMSAIDFGYTIQTNLMYIFGGQNGETGELRPSQLMIVNLDTLTGKRLETKGAVPSPCINPNILFLNKGSLLLHGGKSMDPVSFQMEHANNIYVYKLDARNWIKCEQNFKSKLPTLVKPHLLALTENQLYLFGGSRQVSSNTSQKQIELVPSTQFYKLKPISKITSPRPDVLVRQIYSTNPPPFKQGVYKAFGMAERYIICILEEEQGKEEGIAHIWAYDSTLAVWVQMVQEGAKPGLPINFLPVSEKIYIIQQLGKVSVLALNLQIVEKDAKEVMAEGNPNLCNICASKSLSLNLPSVNQTPLLNAQQFRSNFQSLEFPFAAIGLLVDNAILTGAKNCNVLFGLNALGKESNSDGNKFIIVEDNGQPGMIWNKEITPEMFNQIARSIYVTGLAADNMVQESIQQQIDKSLKEVDRKEKLREKELALFYKQQAKGSQNLPINSLVHIKSEKDFEKEQIENLEKKHRLEYKRKITHIARNRKSFINNLKAAGTRLGSFIISASKERSIQQSQEPHTETKESRKFIILLEETNESTNEEQYSIMSYMTINGLPSDPSMDATFKLATKQFKRELKIIAERLKTMNNVVYIGNLRKIQVEDSSQPTSQQEPATATTTELQYRKKYNDIFYGDPYTLNSLQAHQQIIIPQCCDISLKAYLSLLYLRQEDLSIGISVKENPLEVINSQPFLPHIDKMSRCKKIYDLEECFDFGDECNIVEIYWNPEGWKPQDNIKHFTGSFVLNGVLIYHQGRLVSRYQTELGSLLDSLETDPKLGCMFGYIEVKDMFPVNMVKTGFTQPGTMEKYFGRLKFVQEYMSSRGKIQGVRARHEDGRVSQQKITKRIKND